VLFLGLGALPFHEDHEAVEIMLLWNGAVTLVLTPFLLLAFMFVLLSSHVDQETAQAENCLDKGGENQPGDRSSS